MKTFLNALVVSVALISSAFAADHVPVRLTALTNFSAQDENKIRDAAELLERVLNSDELKSQVLAYEFKDDSGLTNEQIYVALMSRVVEFDLELYKPPFWRRWSVVGYTNPGSPRIYLNRYYFNSFELADIAANLAHEWMHKLGFGHDYKPTARRPQSVPYAVGRMVGEIAAKVGS